jgi:ribonuclease PH
MSTRPVDVLRPLSITPDYTNAPLASVLIECGETRVMCTASLDEHVPRFRLSSGGGWLTAEYSMLPGATPHRTQRGVTRGKLDGRSTEIQRLIGRSLRAGFDLDRLGSHTIWVDCDVLQADGGTRTASITGGYVAARLGMERLIAAGRAEASCLLSPIAAVSVGIIEGVCTLDLDYRLDSAAEVDMNVVMNGEGNFIEVQGTAEGAPFSRDQLSELLALASNGLSELRAVQDDAVARGLSHRSTAQV